MKRILLIMVLIALGTGASAQEKCPNKTCESTWTQWFANTAIFVMVEQYAATKIPQLTQLNGWMADKAAIGVNLATTWIMAKYRERSGGTVASENKSN